MSTETAGAQISRLTREREALRAALQQIADQDWTFDRSRRRVYGIGATLALAALASLEPKEGQE